MLVALGCGVAPDEIVFSGVAKTDDEIDRAIGARIGAIQVESLEELDRVDARARGGGPARESPSASTRGWRKGPSIRTPTSRRATTRRSSAYRSDECRGRSSSERSRSRASSSQASRRTSGSQLATSEAYVGVGTALFGVARARASKRRDPRIRRYRRRLRDRLRRWDRRATGRFRARRPRARSAPIGPRRRRATRRARARAGRGARRAPRSRHPASKRTASPVARWLVIDAGMNDLIRPALYQARHRIVPLAAPSHDEDDLPRSWWSRLRELGRFR